MKARLLIASLIVAFAATAHAQQYRTACPNYNAEPLSAPSLWNSGSGQELFNSQSWRDIERIVTEPNPFHPKNGMSFNPPAWQSVTLKPTYTPQEQKKYDAPEPFILENKYFDSTALFNAADIAGPGCDGARWYGRDLEPNHDYDPGILIHGDHHNLDSGILIHNGASDLMLWYHLNDQPKLDSSFWKQFPAPKIDSNAYNELLLNENDLLTAQGNLLFAHNGNDSLFYSGNPLMLDGNGPVLSGSIDLPSSNYYYEQDGKRYYMQNVPSEPNRDPGMSRPHSKPQAKRVGKSDIWLIDSGK